MKSYYDFMFFSTMCSSVIGFKCVIGIPKKVAGNLSDPKNSGNFAKPGKIAKNLPTQKNRIWPNFKPKNRMSKTKELLT